MGGEGWKRTEKKKKKMEVEEMKGVRKGKNEERKSGVMKGEGMKTYRDRKEEKT